MAATTLSDVVELIKNNDGEILENQEEGNTSLKSIDRNIMEFLGMQKRARLDDLENERERKSSRLSGLGAAAVGAGIGAGVGGGLGSLVDAALGEGNTGKMLGAALGGLAVPLLYRAISGIFSGVRNLITGITERINRIRIDAEARIAEIDDRIKAKQAELENLNKEEKTAKRTARADINDPRTTATENDIRLRAAEEARIKSEQKRVQAEISSFEQDRMTQERLRDDAIEAEKKRGAERRKEALDLERRKEAADKIREADSKAEVERLKTAQTDVESFQRAEDASSRVSSDSVLRKSQADIKAHLDAGGKLPPGVTMTKNGALQQELPSGGKRFISASEVAPRLEPVSRVKPTTPPVGLEYDDSIIRQARTPLPEVPPAKAVTPKVSGVGAKVLGPVALAADVGLSVALGGGAQVEEDLMQGQKSTVNAVVGSSVQDFVSGTVGLIDLGANLINAGADVLGQAVTGDESFTVGRSDLATPAGEMAKNLVTATDLGAETNISGGTAGALLGAKQNITGTTTAQLESFTAMAEVRKKRYKTALDAGRISKATYDANIKSENDRIAEMKAQIQSNVTLEESKRITYAEPTSAGKTAELQSVAQNVESAQTQKNPGTVISAPSQTRTDNSVNVRNTYSGGANNVDPNAFAVPGFR
jgi:hypothetical protein